MSDRPKSQKKRDTVTKLFHLFTKYKQIILVKLDNVSSLQIQQARIALRNGNKGIMVVGKNTLIRKAIQIRLAEPTEDDTDFEARKGWTALPQLDRLTNLCRQKVGLVFSDEPVFELIPILEGNRKPAPARVGTLAPLDVTVPAGPTGLDPSQISFFHALSVSTKIMKGQIEITKDYKVCTKNEKITNSQAVLLTKLNIKPFSYGMEIQQVYNDGSIMDRATAAITPEEIIAKFANHSNKVASLSLALGEPNFVSVPHMIANKFKALCAIAVETDLKFKQMESLGSGSAPAQVADAPADKKEAAKKVEKVEEEEEVDIGGGGLFGDDDDF
jgi:large subunit ribosomal protein LP0